MILLERKNLPEHLQKIENVDTVVTLRSILSDLQDCGEVVCLITVPHIININILRKFR